MICRYASLYFCMCIDADDNELEVLEIIHHFVEILDRYFGSVSLTNLLSAWTISNLEVLKWFSNFFASFHFTFQVCELDLIFNFHKVIPLVAQGFKNATVFLAFVLLPWVFELKSFPSKIAGILYIGWDPYCWWTSGIQQKNCCPADSCTGMLTY